MTHGEAYVHRRNSASDAIAPDTYRLPKRMGRKEALAYYGDKIKKVFGTEETVRDFRSVDDFYDFHEAKRLLQKLGRVKLCQKCT